MRLRDGTDGAIRGASLSGHLLHLILKRRSAVLSGGDGRSNGGGGNGQDGESGGELHCGGDDDDDGIAKMQENERCWCCVRMSLDCSIQLLSDAGRITEGLKRPI